jgi:hypothetical protein
VVRRQAARRRREALEPQLRADHGRVRRDLELARRVTRAVGCGHGQHDELRAVEVQRAERSERRGTRGRRRRDEQARRRTRHPPQVEVDVAAHGRRAARGEVLAAVREQRDRSAARQNVGVRGFHADDDAVSGTAHREVVDRAGEVVRRDRRRHAAAVDAQLRDEPCFVAPQAHGEVASVGRGHDARDDVLVRARALGLVDVRRGLRPQVDRLDPHAQVLVVVPKAQDQRGAVLGDVELVADDRARPLALPHAQVVARRLALPHVDAVEVSDRQHAAVAGHVLRREGLLQRDRLHEPPVVEIEQVAGRRARDVQRRPVL